ncbi:MAG: competence/damage-inducible protein A [Acidobacteriota bacterium]|nr:MAG: competence/damage-inducible protein A [Acidobacteriota bacterium]
MSERADAAILLIGNELLSGRVRDENLQFLARELWELGMPVRRAWFIRDSVEEIAIAVGELARAHSWLFTTGGIGPTHDDVTVEGVARAFGVALETHPRLEDLIRLRFGSETSAPHLRMALVPRGAVLEGRDDRSWPTIRVENTLILPGVPWILQRKFAVIKESFRQSPLHRSSLSLIAGEAELAPILEAALGNFPDVEIGSYPAEGHVLVTFEGVDADRVRRACQEVDRASAAFPRAP